MKTTGYMELYETRKLLEDLLYEAASYRDYKDPATGGPRIDKETGEPVLTREEFDKVVAIDPTPTKSYAAWLVPQFVRIRREAKLQQDDEPIRLFFEDSYRIVDAIKVFQQLKQLKPEGFNLDIMSYKTIPQLLDAVEPFKENTEEGGEAKVNITSKSAKGKDIDLLYEDDQWKILIPRSWAAGRKYGAYTRWCTAVGDETGRGHWNGYNPPEFREPKGVESGRSNGTGPLIIIWDKSKPLGWPSPNMCTIEGLEARLAAGKPPTPAHTESGYPSFKYQIHLATDQFKGASDMEVNGGYGENAVDNRTKILKSLPPAAQDALAKVGVNRFTYELIGMFRGYNETLADDAGETIRALIAHGADPHVKGEAVLRWAVKAQDNELADWLIRDLATDRKVIADFVTEAAAAGNFEMVQKLVGIVGPDAINANGGRAFVAATKYPIETEENSILEKVKKVLTVNARLPREQRQDVAALVEKTIGRDGMARYNALCRKVEAFYGNASPIVHYFIDNGADPNSQGGEALNNLCKWSNEYVLEILKFLLDHGADVNVNASLAWWTAWNCHRPRVLALIKQYGGKANPDRVNTY